MAQQNTKKIGQPSINKPVSKIDALHDAWTVIKPFVRFSIKTMRVIAHVLIFIVKNIPKPDNHKPKSKNNKVIEI